MDAIARCIEAFCATGFHPLSDAMAVDGIARGLRGLKRAVQDPRDEAGRLDLMVAAVEAAAAAQKGAGACEALARAGEAAAGVRHGLMAGICLPLVVEYNRPAVLGRLAKIAVAMGEPATGREERLALTVVERLVNFARTVNLPERLKDIGLRQEQLEVIAETAAQDRALSTNPRSLSRDDLLGILFDAW
jgi:alcohol dehydrogenase class IV